MDKKAKFKSEFSRLLRSSADKVSLFWKGRVGLYAILKSLDIEPGDEIILPAYTCVVVPNPIIYLGARPVYVDVDPLTYNLDPEKVRAAISPKTRVILAQNTYGLSSELDSLLEIAQENNLTVIEDCTHGLGGRYRGKPNGTIADIAFFSSQWNKPFSTGLGGMVWTRDENVSTRLQQFEDSLTPPSTAETVLLRVLYFTREYLLHPSLYWSAVRFYRWLSQHNLIIGSSQGTELERPEMPEDFLKGFSEFQAKIGIQALQKFESVIKHRKKVASALGEILDQLGIQKPFVPEHMEHGYLKYPILVKDRAKFMEAAMEAKIELGDWFISPIHPVTQNFHLWHYQYGKYPIAEALAEHVVNLPTHPDVDEAYLSRIHDFLKPQRSLIYDSNEECIRKHVRENV